MAQVTVRSQGVSLLLIVIAIILFVLAALGVDVLKGFSLGWLGLAFFAASFVF